MPQSPFNDSYAQEIERIKAEYYARSEKDLKELASKSKFNEEVRQKRLDCAVESNPSFFSRIRQYRRIEKDYENEWEQISTDFKRSCDENRRISREAIERAQQTPPQYDAEDLPPYEE